MSQRLQRSALQTSRICKAHRCSTSTLVPASIASSSSLRRISTISLPPSLPVRTFTTSRPALKTPPPHINDTTVPIKELTTREYERISDEDMDIMHENLEELCEDYLAGGEVEYSSGVMTLITPSGTYVINKQPPNQQIWISSPFSGPARFGYSPDGVWVHHRKEGVTLGDLLDKELKQIIGEDADWKGVGLK